LLSGFKILLFFTQDIYKYKKICLKKSKFIIREPLRWIRTYILNTDPDPREPIIYGESGSASRSRWRLLQDFKNADFFENFLCFFHLLLSIDNKESPFIKNENKS